MLLIRELQVTRTQSGEHPASTASCGCSGFDVSERTVSRYMPKRLSDPDARQRWMTFLQNHRHGLAAVDSFTVPTVTFQVPYLFFLVLHARREDRVPQSVAERDRRW